MSQPLKMLATDFDGTLMTLGAEQAGPSLDSFKEWVSDIQAHDGVWVVCTGRNYSSFRLAYPFLECPEIMPDFLVTRRGRVFERRGVRFRFKAMMSWRVVVGRGRASRKIQQIMGQARRALASGVEPIVAGEAGARRIRLCMADADAAKRLAARIGRFQKNENFVSVCVERDRIDVRPIPQSKGIALGELQRLLGFDATETLAVGDGINDISMFGENLAQWTGCPQNAGHAVVQCITERGGHVAIGKGISGTVEVINACLLGKVSTEPVLCPAMGGGACTTDRLARRMVSSRIREAFLGFGVLVTTVCVVYRLLAL
jgi:hydroxymethylpyrimidine pyrophosphatase-like HAD family hydrolase